MSQNPTLALGTARMSQLSLPCLTLAGGCELSSSQTKAGKSAARKAGTCRYLSARHLDASATARPEPTDDVGDNASRTRPLEIHETL